jgi:hypothetical protein
LIEPAHARSRNDNLSAATGENCKPDHDGGSCMWHVQTHG